jgi:hypothetical protein
MSFLCEIFNENNIMAKKKKIEAIDFIAKKFEWKKNYFFVQKKRKNHFITF